ncbi:MAG: ATP-binding protein [Candidatus Eremiobacteraeota bacterium]|nr:ATP-binding protein [Candidatus Eremiobacteraeota bacterium]MBV8369228.1 ATP-binding protein [Candidatus Eremiobacteraeota bacterium]
MAVIWEAEGEAARVLRERGAFRNCLAALAEPSDGIDAAELIYGELVANTVRHAPGDVRVRLELCDSEPPVLVVRDHGPGLRCYPWTPRREPYAESGRGLGIVEMLAREIEVDSARGGGTVIRATLPVRPREAA